MARSMVTVNACQQIEHGLRCSFPSGKTGAWTKQRRSQQATAMQGATTANLTDDTSRRWLAEADRVVLGQGRSEVLARGLEHMDEDGCGAAGGLLAGDGAGHDRGTRALRRDLARATDDSRRRRTMKRRARGMGPSSAGGRRCEDTGELVRASRTGSMAGRRGAARHSGEERADGGAAVPWQRCRRRGPGRGPARSHRSSGWWRGTQAEGAVPRSCLSIGRPWRCYREHRRGMRRREGAPEGK